MTSAHEADAVASAQELRAAVLALYRRVDAAVAAAGPICVASGKCCRFKEYGHVLYLSQLEADVLLADAPAFAEPVTPDFCPWQRDNLCTAREPRPLGCRIYYCDPTYQETGNALTEQALQDLKALALRFGRDWLYAPLHYFLRQAAEQKTSAVTSTTADRSTKLALPLC